MYRHRTSAGPSGNGFHCPYVRIVSGDLIALTKETLACTMRPYGDGTLLPVGRRSLSDVPNVSWL